MELERKDSQQRDALDLPNTPEELGPWVNEQHRLRVAATMTTFQFAYNAGMGLLKVKRLLKHGEFTPWLAENFHGSERTARDYMRVARELPAYLDGEGETAAAADLSIRGALRELEEAKPARPSNRVHPSLQEEPEEKSALEFVKLPNGQEVSPAEAATYYNQFLANLTKEKEKVEKAKREVDRARDKARKKQAVLDEKLENLQVEANTQFRENVKASFDQQLLDLHARYGIKQTPTLFEVDEEHWQTALQKTRDRREEEIVKALSDFFPVVSRIWKY